MVSLNYILAVVFAFFVIISSAFSQVKADYTLEYDGSGLWSPLMSVVIKDNYAYCAMRYGIRILDIRDVSDPVLGRQIYLNDFAYSMEIEDTLLFIGFLGAGFQIYNISNPLCLDLIGECQVGYKIRDIFIKDEHAYLACECGLVIIDISDLNNPEIIGQFETQYWLGYYGTNVTIKDTLAYLAAYDLWIINITDPRNPIEVSRFETPYAAFDLKLKDSVLFIADQTPYTPSVESALTILNVKNPEAPELISSYEFRGHLNYMQIKENYVYLCASASGLVIFDISDPSNPFPVSCFPTYDEVLNITLKDNFAFLANFRPIIPDEHEKDDICGDYDSSFSSNDKSLDSLDGDLIILDVSDVSDPTLISTYSHLGYVLNFVIDSNFAFISNTETCTEYGVTIADISTVDNFEVVSTINTPGIVNSIALSGYTLYLADAYGLQIADVSDIETPQLIGNYNTNGLALDIAVTNNIAFIADCWGGLVILNVSDPENINYLSTFNTEDYTTDIIVNNNIAYVADRFAGLKIVDVSDPEHPFLLSRYPELGIETLINKLILQDTVLFCGGGAFIDIINISDPENPLFISQYAAHHTIYGFSVFEDYLYLGLSDIGVDAVDISDIHNPEFICRYNTNGWAQDICSTNKDYLYVADYFGLLRFKKPIVTSVSDIKKNEKDYLPSGFKLYQNYPNPFNPTTRICFSLYKKANIKLSVYNVLGQHVKTLINGVLSSGNHSVEWNSEDESGNKVASGIYIYKLLSDDVSISKKMILLK